jgi:hypothetical protein
MKKQKRCELKTDLKRKDSGFLNMELSKRATVIAVAIFAVVGCGIVFTSAATTWIGPGTTYSINPVTNAPTANVDAPINTGSLEQTKSGSFNVASTAPNNSLFSVKNTSGTIVFSAGGASSIGYFAGNVGIGVNSPTVKLDVNGAIKATGDICTTTGGTTKCIAAGGGTTGLTGTGITNYVAKWGGASALTNSLILDNGSSIGIGTSTPGAYKLDVWGSAYNNIARIYSTGSSSGLDFYDGGVRRGMVYSGGASGFGLLNAARDWSIRITPTYVEVGPYLNGLTVLNNGNVGLGVANPGAKLEINGQIKITGGSPGAGKTLVSDANGLASWGVPSGSVSTVVGSSCPTGSLYVGSHYPTTTFTISDLRCSCAKPQVVLGPIVWETGAICATYYPDAAPCTAPETASSRDVGYCNIGPSPNPGSLLYGVCSSVADKTWCANP